MDLDGPHPAENRKVGGSIPSLPTRSAQLRGLCAGTSPLDEPEIPAFFRQSPWLAPEGIEDHLSGRPVREDHHRHLVHLRQRDGNDTIIVTRTGEAMPPT